MAEIAHTRAEPLTREPGKASTPPPANGSSGEAAPKSLAVLVVGVDRLREITDALGPPAGEQVVAVTAARLGALHRRGMTIAPLIGGAFALVLGEPTSREEVLSFASEVLEAISTPITVEDEELTVSLSAGIAFGSSGPVAARGVLRDAAAAQHRAQRRGGGCIEVFAPEHGAGLLEQLRLEGELRRAVNNAHAGRDSQGLTLFFQPIMSLQSGAVTAVEALVRWDHPTQGLLLPNRFLPLAERSGILPRIEQWVLAEACRLLAQWGLPNAPAQVRRVSVNVSPAALSDPGFVASVAEQLHRHSLHGDQLIIELNEQALLPGQSLGPHARGSAGAATRVQELRALGVSVYLDDFGAGYTSISQLERIPVDGIKLGRSLSAQADERGIAGVVDGIVEHARSLGLTVIAKDVETQQQLERVRELGASAAQGLYFLGSVPANTLLDVLALSEGERSRQHADDAPSAAAVAPAPSDPASEERAVTLGQAAKLLGISASTLRRWTEDGRVNAVRTSGGHRRFYVSELARLGSATGAQLRVPSMPDTAIPDIADLLHREGAELASAVARSLYEEGTGWFGQEQAIEPTRAWIVDLATAFEEGTYEPLTDSLRQFMLSAAVGGTTLAERHVFLERFGAALETRLNRAERPQREQAAARRAISALALVELADDDSAANHAGAQAAHQRGPAATVSGIRDGDTRAARELEAPTVWAARG